MAEAAQSNFGIAIPKVIGISTETTYWDQFKTIIDSFSPGLLAGIVAKDQYDPNWVNDLSAAIDALMSKGVTDGQAQTLGKSPQKECC